MVGIYKIISPTKKIYIGQSLNIEKRFKQYKSIVNCKSQRYLYNSLLKYGSLNHTFKIICILPNDVSQSVLNNYESIYYEFYKNCDVKVLNIRYPGSKGSHSKQTKIRMSISQIKSYKQNPNRITYRRKIYQYSISGNFIDEFLSIKEASKKLNISESGISSNTRGITFSASGYIFSYHKHEFFPYLGKFRRVDI